MNFFNTTAKMFYKDSPNITETTEFRILCEHSLCAYIDGEFVNQFTCSPEYLRELVQGWLMTEGYVKSAEDINAISFAERDRTVNIELKQRGELRPLEHVSPIEWMPEWIYRMGSLLDRKLPVYKATNGAHSAFLMYDGEIRYVCEDIGRHNALDKVIGCALQDKVDLGQCILYSSGRAPSDMVRKVIRAGIPVFAVKSVPTAEAGALAKKYGLTLLFQARDASMKQLILDGDETLERI